MGKPISWYLTRRLHVDLRLQASCGCMTWDPAARPEEPCPGGAWWSPCRR